MNRELDARVAVEVLGWELRDTFYADGEPSGQLLYDGDGDSRGAPGEGWQPSVRIQQAWLVVEKMREHPESKYRTLRIVAYSYNRTYAAFDSSEDWCEANGEHATPEAICLAALKVVEAA